MIQTVNGEVRASDFGKTLVHEHVSCVSNHFLNAFGKTWLDREYLAEYATEVLKTVKEKYGVGLIVDGTIMEIGRDASLLKKVSESSGVHIVASTGFYRFHDFGFDGVTENVLADFLLKECEKGMDGTDIKPGILKCAAGCDELSNELVKKHACVGIVQKETGLPVYVHCEHSGDIIFDQIDVLTENGANVEKLIVGHCAKRPEFDYLEQILIRGCYISMDQCICFPSKLSEMAKCIVQACRKGYVDKILVSNDYCIHSDFQARKKNGFHLGIAEQAENLGHVFERLYLEFVRAGGKQEDWELITTKNTVNVLSI